MEVLRGFMKIAYSLSMSGFETGDRHRRIRKKFSSNGKIGKAIDSFQCITSHSSIYVQTIISRINSRACMHIKCS
jgi:hypothetical protein